MISRPEAADNSSKNVPLVTASNPLDVSLKNETVGIGSSSVIVKVQTVLASKDELVGEDNVMVKVSSSSSRMSSVI